jgi:hypothetical protein
VRAVACSRARAPATSARTVRAQFPRNLATRKPHRPAFAPAVRRRSTQRGHRRIRKAVIEFSPPAASARREAAGRSSCPLRDQGAVNSKRCGPCDGCDGLRKVGASAHLPAGRAVRSSSGPTAGRPRTAPSVPCGTWPSRRRIRRRCRG